MSKPFHFKQFSIIQEACAMKVGTDGVLLGAWCEGNGNRMLDIGTGSGLIALMLAQRFPDARIVAIDIDSLACCQAKENFFNSPWNERIHLKQLSIFDMEETDEYDLIVCNPPFFINSTTTPQVSRTVARHCDDKFHLELLRKVGKLLAPTGRLSLVLPIEIAKMLTEQAVQFGLYIERQTSILPTPEKEAKRALISFTKEKKVPRFDQLVVELSRHHYSSYYKDLTNDFYLALK